MSPIVCRVCKGRRLLPGPSGHPEDATNCQACENDEAEQMSMRAMMGLAEPTPIVGLSAEEETEFREWIKGIDSREITARNAWAARAMLAKMRGER